ncbi:hypothetical protein B0H13DRAFT_2031112 [Mycena leptocephala]|nr:hypothetical protein B0H13DRAFT_2031112 [Mycena leptocephala]
MTSSSPSLVPSISDFTSEVATSFTTGTFIANPPFSATPFVPQTETITEPTNTVPTSSPEVSSSSSSTGSPTGATAAVQNDGGISTTAVAGLSLGLGLLVGLIGATLIYFYRRRHAAAVKNARSMPRDGEALLGYRDELEEKQIRLDSPVPQPAAVPHARIMEWVQRTRTTSISSIASSYFPTIVSDSQSTVVRSQSMASSKSAYSQASAFPSSASQYEFEGGPSRPPDLYKINE